MKKIKKAFRKGFSLIELSIVLIIIGLLMAAIIKGKDLIRSAEMKKFYNTFVKGWELVYTQYYDRTGTPLGGPLYINDTATNQKVELTDFVGEDVGISNADFVLRKSDTIETRAKDVGLTLPNTGSGKSYEYRVTFTDVPPSTVYVTFGSDPLRSGESLRICKEDNCTNIDYKTGNGNNRGNFMIMVNVPYDVAAQIDRIIDGKADGQNGNVICVANYKNPKNSATDTPIDAAKVKDLGQSYNCTGSLHWGDENTPYVTLMYKIGI